MKFLKKEKTLLEEERDRIEEQLKKLDPTSEDYGVLCKRLYSVLDVLEKSNKIARKISPEAKATIAANLLGIAVMAGMEYARTFSSKAFALIRKL